MIRVAIILFFLALILLGIVWIFRWLTQKRVRITMHRAPTGREMLWISVALQMLRSLLRLLFRI
jgi:hypothetical protein